MHYLNNATQCSSKRVLLLIRHSHLTIFRIVKNSVVFVMNISNLFIPSVIKNNRPLNWAAESQHIAGRYSPNLHIFIAFALILVACFQNTTFVPTHATLSKEDLSAVAGPYYVAPTVAVAAQTGSDEKAILQQEKRPFGDVNEVVAAPSVVITRHIASGGVNTGNCSNEAAPCASIGYAIGQAVNGDVVLIQPGTYTESDINVNKQVFIIGASTYTDTIISANPSAIATSGAVFWVNLASSGGSIPKTFELRNLTIRDGGAGGQNTAMGVYISDTSGSRLQAILDHVNISFNSGAGISSTEFSLAHLSSVITLTNSIISNNGGYGIWTTTDMVISNTTIAQNSHTGIYSKRDVRISNSQVMTNTPPNSAGAVGSGVDIVTNTTCTKCLFVMDSTLVRGNGQGVGALQLREVTATLSNSSIISNVGAGVKFVDNVSITLNSVTVSDNTGAGVDVAKNGTSVAKIQIDQASLARNQSYGLLVATSTRDGALTVTNSSITGNVQAGVFVEANTNNTVINSMFDNVTITQNAGHGVDYIHIDSITSLTMLNSDISRNINKGIQTGAHLVVSNTVIAENGNTGIDNTAILYIYALSKTLDVINSHILSNTYPASGNGGSGIKTYGLLTVNNSEIRGNYSNVEGGGINATARAITITRSTIENNHTLNNSAGFGGGIYLDHARVITTNVIETGVYLLQDTLIENNDARFGGGIAIKQGDLILSNVTITNNRAISEGAGVAAYTTGLSEITINSSLV